MKNLRLIFIAFAMVSLLGCKKFLEVKPNAKLVIPSTLADLQGLLDDADRMNFLKTPTLGECVADDYFLTPDVFASREETQQAIYLWQPFENRFANDWSEAYQPIYNANLVLELIEKVPREAGNASAWDNVKGSALFFRAYYYALLTMNYGKAYDPGQSASDPGVVLRLASDFNIKASRSTVKACFARVIADADQAAALLPNLSTQSTRPSKAAAFALLSRTYLYMRDYQKAIANADECLKIKSTLMNLNGDQDVLGLTLNVPFKRFNKETIFYTEGAPNYGINSPTRARIDSVLYNSYQLNDLRRTGYFRLVSGYQQFKGSYASSSTLLFSGLAVDEILLNRAEGRARLGQVNLAMDDLNLLLKSRWKNTVPYVPMTALDEADAVAKVRMERRKELLMRQTRFTDIKRLNMEGANITIRRIANGKIYELAPNAPYYALPIPADIIEQTGIEKN
ncbi:MAG: RagB/SusD family nutrient uptake outer membrane protein [Pedobacter sp.]|nr:MAG: RagB/SusD family nutrient uptake outer membrane protein [Pedobacter sp.]